jgi:electron transfer flavoprotein alpha subunit
MPALLLADHDSKTLSDQTAKALTAALQIDPVVDLLVMGDGVGAIARSAAQLAGVREVLVADHPVLGNFMAEPVSGVVMSLAEAYEAIVASATSNGKNVMPRIAALLDVAQVSDILAVVAPDIFKRPIYAGNAIQTVQTTDARKVVTVRSSAFAAAGPGSAAPIREVAVAQDKGPFQFVRAEVARSDRPELMGASIVVSGGRALGSKENFDALLLPLADKLGAAVGASRAAVDSGYASNELQVGQTGKAVAPSLYIAIGISGAIQHLAGMTSSKVIVAINRDPDAPIFQIADYGLVGDLFEIVPRLQRLL